MCVVAGAMGATTHALLRRATQHGTFLLFVLWCYNSRSPAESDVIERSIFTLSNRYNSRSPAESDHLSIAVQGILDATTHALLRRATLPSGIYCLLFSGYNSRSPAESDIRWWASATARPCYNSRSPAESDSSLGAFKTHPHRLQLTLSCGERPGEAHIQVNCEGATTHALLRRATGTFNVLDMYLSATTHALLRRATDALTGDGELIVATTHALLRRATVILTEFVIDATSNCGN